MCHKNSSTEYFITPHDLEELTKSMNGAINPISLIQPLTIEEVEKMRRFQLENSEMLNTAANSALNHQPIPDGGEESLSEAYINATTKPCPTCGYRATHYHGHRCHHVSEGCARCRAQFCYRCLCTAEENSEQRGSRGACKCGGWSKSDDRRSQLIRTFSTHGFIKQATFVIQQPYTTI